MRTLAYATGIEPFLNNAILDPDFAQRFPGAAVWPEAARVAREQGWDFLTADVALGRIRSGELESHTVRVIQEEDAPLGRQLIEEGARASLVLCGESPLFARNFYRQLPRVSAGFDHALLFRGAEPNVAPGVKTHPLHFPGFHRDALLEVQPWQTRREIVMVGGNKYWNHHGLPIPQRLQEYSSRIRNRRYFEWLKRHQLHGRRLELVSDLSAARILTLYGPGWDTFHHLPPRWRERLSSAGVSSTPLDYADKQQTVGGFKFALCMENFEYPGYVTEKIVDAIAAGAIPVYQGAPDVVDFVPPDVFIDLRDFDSTSDLIAFLGSMDESRGMAMVERGRNFLANAQGDHFSYEKQGEVIAELAIR